jgi:hypothetical protein
MAETPAVHLRAMTSSSGGKRVRIGVRSKPEAVLKARGLRILK